MDQSRDSLNGENTVWQEISEEKETIQVGNREVNSRAYVSSFNFKGTDQQKKVAGLSGGERNRVHLAKLIKGGGNLLLLDEPTNDLDVDTLRSLEAALLDFAGCAVVLYFRHELNLITTGEELAVARGVEVDWVKHEYRD